MAISANLRPYNDIVWQDSDGSGLYELEIDHISPEPERPFLVSVSGAGWSSESAWAPWPTQRVSLRNASLAAFGSLEITFRQQETGLSDTYTLIPGSTQPIGITEPPIEETVPPGETDTATYTVITLPSVNQDETGGWVYLYNSGGFIVAAVPSFYYEDGSPDFVDPVLGLNAHLYFDTAPDGGYSAGQQTLFWYDPDTTEFIDVIPTDYALYDDGSLVELSALGEETAVTAETVTAETITAETEGVTTETAPAGAIVDESAVWGDPYLDEQVVDTTVPVAQPVVEQPAALPVLGVPAWTLPSTLRTVPLWGWLVIGGLALFAFRGRR